MDQVVRAVRAEMVLLSWELELELVLEGALEATEALREKEQERARAADVAQQAAEDRRPVADQEVCRVSRFLSPSEGLHWEDLRIPGMVVVEPAQH